MTVYDLTLVKNRETPLEFETHKYYASKQESLSAFKILANREFKTSDKDKLYDASSQPTSINGYVEYFVIGSTELSIKIRPELQGAWIALIGGDDTRDFVIEFGDSYTEMTRKFFRNGTQHELDLDNDELESVFNGTYFSKLLPELKDMQLLQAYSYPYAQDVSNEPKSVRVLLEVFYPETAEMANNAYEVITQSYSVYPRSMKRVDEVSRFMSYKEAYLNYRYLTVNMQDDLDCIVDEFFINHSHPDIPMTASSDNPKLIKFKYTHSNRDKNWYIVSLYVLEGK